MKMQAVVVPKPIKVEVNGEAKKFLELQAKVVQEEEVEVYLIREMFNVTIVTGMATLKENAD